MEHADERERIVDYGFHLVYIEPVWLGFSELWLYATVAEEPELEEQKIVSSPDF